MKVNSYKYFIEYGNFLYILFCNISEKDLIWHITDDDVIKGTKWLFEKEDYSGKEFINLIKENDSLPIFCNIKIYKSNGIKNIDENKSFLNNDYEIMIIIIDNMFIDIYSNNKVLEEIIKKNLEIIGAKNIINEIIINNNVLEVQENLITYKYVCDKLGNVIEIHKEGNLIRKYTYNEKSQLIQDDNLLTNITTKYTYDNFGNILSKMQYANDF